MIISHLCPWDADSDLTPIAHTSPTPSLIPDPAWKWVGGAGAGSGAEESGARKKGPESDESDMSGRAQC